MTKTLLDDAELTHIIGTVKTDRESDVMALFYPKGS